MPGPPVRSPSESERYLQHVQGSSPVNVIIKTLEHVLREEKERFMFLLKL